MWSRRLPHPRQPAAGRWELHCWEGQSAVCSVLFFFPTCTNSDGEKLEERKLWATRFSLYPSQLGTSSLVERNSSATTRFQLQLVESVFTACSDSRLVAPGGGKSAHNTPMLADRFHKLWLKSLATRCFSAATTPVLGRGDPTAVGKAST